MKITSVNRTLKFGAQNQDVNFDASKKEKKKKYVDPLANWPMRGLGYTNDIGIAINELAPATARLFWVPALMYFGADIYDKYKNKGDKYKPNAQRAFNQAVFQACASILFPAIFGHIGMSAFSQIDKFRGEKLSTNAKEQTLRFIKAHATIDNVAEGGVHRDELISDFEKSYNKFYAAKSRHYQHKNIFVKMYDKLLANCKHGAIANSNEERIKAFAKRQFIETIDNCKDAETVKNVLDKKIFKLKAWKSAGAFTAILLTAQAIDKFVEKVIIKKVVQPIQQNVNNKYSFNDFNKSKTEQK
uniref:Uncharacterized protein n=1 Tax=uncultured Candidatus Melainabacteria bacterium TaxID=2682970 RepID=A0A650EKH1_9BACT|nr:hypothetical protein Melaina855_1080 [uncultured Candidatus Melainabacteria bacterium]